MAEPGKAWLLVCALLAKLSLLVWLIAPAAALDWQVGRIAAEPWRMLTAALVHLSLLHLAANLSGCAVLALLGWRAALPATAAWAWLLAWPLTQVGLLLRPELSRYAGLSGVLHAGVAIAALLLATRTGRERWIGLGIAVGLGLKLALEAPLGPVLRQVPGFDFPVAPFAHLSGAVAGVLAWRLTMRGFERSPRSPHGT
ncbi:rhombosortase [Roseateles sp.]|uniref:rhombosortase n=1 Tax=Roseateles sp. TaxID=1971397 RepID=UPI00269BB188